MRLHNFELAFVLGRLLLGLNFLLHGIVKEFAAASLPPGLVSAYATALPFVEGGIGLLLVLGLFTRPALVAAMLVIMSLVFGSSLLEKWSLVGDQMLYGLYIITLVLHLQRNRLCLDPILAPASQATYNQ
jgi:thiosulfate dehydrogenase [quinone] large subunit